MPDSRRSLAATGKVLLTLNLAAFVVAFLVPTHADDSREPALIAWIVVPLVGAAAAAAVAMWRPRGAVALTLALLASATFAAWLVLPFALP